LLHHGITASRHHGITRIRLKPESVKLRHRNLPLLLLQAREQVIGRFRPILNGHGITEQQWRIVRALIDTGPLEPREIGELCRISSPSLAGVLSRMEELGYIKRKRFDHDQRRLRVSLTPRSRALSRRMAPQIEATYRDIETVIGTEFSARFYRALDELIGALSVRGPKAPVHNAIAAEHAG
jgi:homoprotocatechuate degradation regulator HpaR